MGQWAGFHPAASLRLDSGDVAQGAIVGGAGRFGGYVGGGDDVDLVAKVIEGEHAIEEHEHAVGDVEVVFGVVADILQLAHDVVGAIADGSGGEGRQAFNLGGTMLVEEFLDDVEDAGGAGFDSWNAGLCCELCRAPWTTGSEAVNRDLVAARFEAQERTHAQEGVAADFFAAFDGFEEEGVGLSSATARKAETGVSRSAEMDFATGTSVAWRARRANSL